MTGQAGRPSSTMRSSSHARKATRTTPIPRDDTRALYKQYEALRRTGRT